MCKGDGECAGRVDIETGEIRQMPCPYKNCQDYVAERCREIGFLRFIMPEVPGHGIWEIKAAKLSMIDLKSEMRYSLMVAGRIAGLPFNLTLEPQEVKPAGQSMKKTVYTLHLRSDRTISEFRALPAWEPLSAAALPAPDDSPEDFEEHEHAHTENGNGRKLGQNGASEYATEQLPLRIRATKKGLTKEGTNRWLLNHFHTEHTRFMDKEECLSAIAMIDRLTDAEVAAWNGGVPRPSAPAEEQEKDSSATEPPNPPETHEEEPPLPSEDEAPAEPVFGDEQRNGRRGSQCGEIRGLWVQLCQNGAKQFGSAKGRLAGIMELAKGGAVNPPEISGSDGRVVEHWLDSAPLEDLQTLADCLAAVLRDIQTPKK